MQKGFRVEQKQQKLRIAMVGQKAAPFYRDGGVERHVEELATRLAEKGHEVTVYVRPKYVATKDDIWKGVCLIRVPSIPTKNLDTVSATFFSVLYTFKESFDIIHFHGIGPSTLAWIPRLCKPKTKIVVTFHSIDRFHKKWGPLARAYLNWGEWTATHFSHATIGVSQSIVRYCKKKFGKHITYIPNGVTIPKLSRARSELARWGLQPGKYMITVARLVRHKGIHYLIQAFQQIPDSIKGELKLVIVGAPSFTLDYEQYLRGLAAEDHRIIFTGFQSGDALRQLYTHALMYVHPSEAEGLSVTILEAMSFGKCVVMSNIPENMESIDHAGVAFKVGDVEDLTRVLVSLINHPDILKERAVRGIIFLEKKFDWSAIVNHTEDIYRKIVKKR